MTRKEQNLPEIYKAPNPATEQDIRAVLGPADDEMVFVIRKTGASKNEILEAFAWLNDDDYIGAKLKKPMSSRTRTVYEILQEFQDDGETDHSRR